MLAAMTEPPLLLALDLTGTFAFALNGAITGLEEAKLDIIGMLTLGMVTALGGGILRDILINALPPATFSSWPYLAVAAGGALIAFFLSLQLRRFSLTILLLDAAGLSLFCVTGATKSLAYGLGPGQAVILGAVTAVGGGTIRDVLVRRVSYRPHQRPVRHPCPGRRRDRGNGFGVPASTVSPPLSEPPWPAS